MSRARRIKTIPLCTWRYYLTLGLVFAAFSLLAARAAHLQVTESNKLNEAGDARSVRVKGIASYRGTITDRNGVELASSVMMKSLWVDPKTLLQNPAVFSSDDWHQLAVALKRSEQELSKWVMDRAERRFVWLERHLEPKVSRFVGRLNLPGVYLQDESRRYYPTAEVTAHLVGFTNVDDQGLEGIERSFDDWLKGQPGQEQVVVDLKRRVVASNGVLAEAEQGKDLALSIDSRLQAMAYRELKAAVTRLRAAAGSVVIVDIETGEVLAMANQPSFNPNRVDSRIPGLTRNRAMTDAYEPGSTAKPFTIVSALQSGQFQKNDVIDTSPGRFRIGRNWVRDSRDYGPLDLTGILQKSSNVGVSRLALQMEDEALLDSFYKVGFGLDSGSGFPGESAGRFAVRANWSKIEKATLSYGYGFQVTPLQLASAYATLGSGGIRRPISLVKTEQPGPGQRVFDQTVARQVLRMMEQVTVEGGTGIQAQLESYRVAGKTGTARKAVAGGYGDDYVSIFAGVAPASAPKLAMVVVIDEPAGDVYYGGDVAAPVFSKTMQSALRLLNVTPDKAPTLASVSELTAPKTTATQAQGGQG